MLKQDANTPMKVIKTPNQQHPGQLDDQKLLDAVTCIDELNRRYAVVKFGSKVHVVDDFADEVSFMTFRDFQNLYGNRRVPMGKSSVSVGSYWLEHPDRRQYPDGVVFDPSKSCGTGHYNLWRGFAVEPDPTKKYDRFLEHLHDVICGQDQGRYDYFLSWLALMVQKPWQLPGVAIVLLSSQGTGKGLLMQYLGAMLGVHYKHLTGRAHLVGQFSGHLHDAVLVFADELSWGSSKEEAGILKGMVTERTRMMERKYADAIPVNNCTHLIVASNEEHVVPAELSDRRYCILDVAETKTGDAAYFSRLAGEMAEGGPSGLLAFLMSRDITGFDPAKFPKTEARIKQQIMSLGPVEAWLEEQLQNGGFTGHEDPERRWPDRIEKYDVYGLYREWHVRGQISAPVASVKRFTSTLKKYGIITCRMQEDEAGRRGRGYRLPSIDAVRASFESLIEGQVDWEDAA